MSQRKSPKQSKRSKTVRRRNAKKARKNGRSKKRTNKQDAKEALNSFFGDEDIFSEYKFHGNIKWTAGDLARIGLLFSWSEKKFVTDAFTETLKRTKKIGITAIHTTYQGFMGAMTNYVHILIPLLIVQLQKKMQEIGGVYWEESGFVPIAFDGSRNSASRTQSNEQELCSAKGKKKAVESPSTVADPKPQAWITLMWHMGFRLPWDWRLGPSDSSERGHVEEMVSEGVFPENTLFVGDAGFVGYSFWRTIVDRDHHFMVRVGQNITLINESVDYEQTEDGEVLCWPQDKQGKHSPLRLRLVQVTIGTADVWLLTSVLCSRQLTTSSMIKLYKMRWGIEIEFRGLKQTLNGQTLRCRDVDRLYTELHWSILSMAVAELLSVSQQVASEANRCDGYTPRDRSLAETMRAIYECLDDLHEVAPPDADLFTRLSNAVTDDYKRKSSKKARFRPKQTEKKKKKPKPPKVRQMNQRERKKLKSMDFKIAA